MKWNSWYPDGKERFNFSFKPDLGSFILTVLTILGILSILKSCVE